MKKTVGYKSAGQINWTFFCAFLLLLLTIMTLSGAIILGGSDLWTYSFLLICATLWFYIFAIMQVVKPDYMIQYDHDNLYLNYRGETITIPLSDITYVLPRRANSRGISYSHGKIIIHTKDVQLEIGYVSECEQVSEEIMHLVHEAHNN